MRLKPEIADFIKSGLEDITERPKIYLFGSRADDSAKGGDIDVLLLTPNKIPSKKIRKFKTSFYKKFGWRKIDIVNFTYDDDNVFKDIALEKAIEL